MEQIKLDALAPISGRQEHGRRPTHVVMPQHHGMQIARVPRISGPRQDHPGWIHDGEINIPPGLRVRHLGLVVEDRELHTSARQRVERGLGYASGAGCHNASSI
jgi:hypothetical protein